MPTMVGDDLADIADLADRVAGDVTDPRLIHALASASARFRGAVRHHVSRIDGDTVTVDGDGSRSLLLPHVPVRAVLWVIADGASLTDYRWFSDGRVVRHAGWPDTRITVTYDHGHDPVPDDIVEAVLDAAESIYTRAHGVRSMAVGGESVTFTEGGVTEGWSQTVARYRIDHGEAP